LLAESSRQGVFLACRAQHKDGPVDGNQDECPGPKNENATDCHQRRVDVHRVANDRERSGRHEPVLGIEAHAKHTRHVVHFPQGNAPAPPAPGLI